MSCGTRVEQQSCKLDFAIPDECEACRAKARARNKYSSAFLRAEFPRESRRERNREASRNAEEPKVPNRDRRLAADRGADLRNKYNDEYESVLVHERCVPHSPLSTGKRTTPALPHRPVKHTHEIRATPRGALKR